MSGSLFRFHWPDERLRPYISAYFFLNIPSGEPSDALMYPEWANIRIALSGAWRMRIGDTEAATPETWSVISGPTTHSFRIHTTPPATSVSIGLLPLGWARLIRRSAALHADRVDPLESVFPEQAEPLRRALLEAADNGTTDHAAACAVLDRFFLSLDEPHKPVPPLLPKAYELMLDPEVTTVEQFADTLGLSQRHLLRLCGDMFGFPPKLLLRRQRFMRSLVALHDNPGQPWSMLIDNNYYDHSHFIRDFHQFMDMSPTEFQASPLVNVDRMAYVRALQLGVRQQKLQVGLPINRPVMAKR